MWYLPKRMQSPNEPLYMEVTFSNPQRCNIIRNVLQYPCDAHQVHNAHPDELLPVAEEDEAHDDVGGYDVQVAEELGQDSRNVAERTLKRTPRLL